MTTSAKQNWHGRITSIQPRMRLTRSFDERSHSYLGYILNIVGHMDGAEDEFTIGIGPAVHEKHQLQVGDRVSGSSAPVANPQMEPADYYKTSKFKLIERAAPSEHTPPPWQSSPPPLDVYRERGRRRLSSHTYHSKCHSCLWGCSMAVEIIIDHWNPRQKKYRTETFCYGPLSCSLYKAGPTRKVPGRKGMVWEEEDWVDLDAISHRNPNE